MTTDPASDRLRVIDLERYDPGDGHSFWRVSAEWCGVVIVFHNRWGRWVTDDFTFGEVYEATGWLPDVLDNAVSGRRTARRRHVGR